MEFEAVVELGRDGPRMVCNRRFTFEAADWDEAHEIVKEQSRKGGYSGYQCEHVVSLERLM
jgi:hypothetical protein